MIHKKCLKDLAEKAVRDQGDLQCPECMEKIPSFEIKSIFG